MRKRIIALMLCFIMILPCMACNNGVQPQNDTQQSQSEPDTEKICWDTELPQKDVEVGNIPIAITDFSVRLLQAEFQNSKGNKNRVGSPFYKNQLLSPFSVLTAIAMLGNGANNETKNQIEETLGISIENLNAFIGRYMQELSQKETRFHMANSIWFTEDEQFTVKENFLNTNKTYYNADIFEKAFDQTTV